MPKEYSITSKDLEEAELATFRYGIDCDSSEVARDLAGMIESLEMFQDDLEVSDERVSLCSNQSLLAELERYSKLKGVAFAVEVWPSDLDFDEAESSGALEFYNYG
jgi:hypothetical protein